MATFLDGEERTQVAFIHTGTYQGDGGVTLAITGVGFQPKYVIIWTQAIVQIGIAWKSDQDGINASVLDLAAGLLRYITDMIISLDADGFTVGDGTGVANAFNINLQDYTYVAYM